MFILDTIGPRRYSTYAKASDAGIPSVVKLISDRSANWLAGGVLAFFVSLSFTSRDKLTESEYTGNEYSKENQQKRNGELTVLSDGGEEWTALSSLPNLMQRRIHVLGVMWSQAGLEGKKKK